MHFLKYVIVFPSYLIICEEFSNIYQNKIKTVYHNILF